MIDPAHWKKEIQRLAKQLESYLGKRTLSHQSRARLERVTMSAYYLLHKLMEDHRVDDSLAESPISVQTTSSEGRSHYLSEYRRVGDSISRGKPTTVSLHLGVLTNKLIHSYLILPISEGAKASDTPTIAICSDFEHYDKIITLPLASLIAPLKSLDPNPMHSL